MHKVGGSFRDPAGYVFDDGSRIVRTINAQYRSAWGYAQTREVFSTLTEAGLLVPFVVYHFVAFRLHR